MNKHLLKLLESQGIKSNDIEDWVYKNNLYQLITRKVYPYYHKSKKKDWKLGKVHKEWNYLLNYYQGLVVLAPRDHLKTFFFSEMYPLQQALKHPNIKIKIFSGSDSLAIQILDNIKKNWAELDYFKHLLKGADLNNKKEIRFSNGSRIDAQGFWSKGRGGHYDIILLDDVIDMDVVYSDELNRKSKMRLASEIIPMAEPDTQIVIVGTIQRIDDAYSINFKNIEESGKRKWFRKVYDAIVDEEKKKTLFPEFWDWESLMSRKRLIMEAKGLKVFNKEYRNMDVNLRGDIIKPDWYQEYEELPEKLDIYTGWDLSTGKKQDEGDWTAKVTFGFDPETYNIYIINVYQERIGFGKRVRKVLEHGKIEKPNLIKIEDNVFQGDTVQTAIKNASFSIKGVTTTKNKIQKYNEILEPLFENGKVFFKKDDKMQKIFWEQLCSLPGAQHDDLSDAFCVGLAEMDYYAKATDLIHI